MTEEKKQVPEMHVVVSDIIGQTFDVGLKVEEELLEEIQNPLVIELIKKFAQASFTRAMEENSSKNKSNKLNKCLHEIQNIHYELNKYQTEEFILKTLLALEEAEKNLIVSIKLDIQK